MQIHDDTVPFNKAPAKMMMRFEGRKELHCANVNERASGARTGQTIPTSLIVSAGAVVTVLTVVKVIVRPISVTTIRDFSGHASVLVWEERGGLPSDVQNFRRWRFSQRGGTVVATYRPPSDCWLVADIGPRLCVADCGR